MYSCNYCRIEHSADTRSKEHIISEKLFNKGYILPDVCKRVNNYISHAFEKNVLTSDPMREMLLRFDPIPKEVFVGEASTSSSGERHHRWIKSGQQFLADYPEYNTESVIKVRVETRKGNRSISISHCPLR